MSADGGDASNSLRNLQMSKLDIAVRAQIYLAAKEVYIGIQCRLNHIQEYVTTQRAFRKSWFIAATKSQRTEINQNFKPKPKLKSDIRVIRNWITRISGSREIESRE